MGTPGAPLSPTDPEILKLRTKYAWDFWEFHGRQRLSMFNYFLLITGILINGYLLALKEHFYHALLSICLLGMLQCLAFFMIDIRNRDMLYFADDLLRHLEEDYLFDSPPYKDLGPTTRRKKEEGSDWWLRNSKMLYWIRGTYGVIAVGFLISAIWLFMYRLGRP
jgi:hypothetical protein